MGSWVRIPAGSLFEIIKRCNRNDCGAFVFGTVKFGINNLGSVDIVRTMNTQKAVTTLAQNSHDEVILIRRCSEHNQHVRKLYDALKFKYATFAKKKSVVHKSELDNCQFTEKQLFRSD